MGLIVNVDKIQKIYTHKANQARLVRFIDDKPEKKGFFGRIKQEAVKAHWSSYYDNYDTREDFISNSCEKGKYFINHDVLYEYSIWVRPYIYIIMSNSEPITIYFDTYEELTEKVKDIIEQSRNNLMVINE
jgi:hypothetical protein